MPKLKLTVAGSTLSAGFDDLQRFKPLLDCADSISVDGLSVQLSGRRWVAFERNVNGSPLICLGYQETVGAVYRAGATIGGSNRKVLAWLHPSGKVTIGDNPDASDSTITRVDGGRRHNRFR